MINHRMVVAWSFRIGAVLLGVPALLVLVIICVSLASSSLPNHSSYLDVGTYGIAGLLSNAAHGASQLFDWLGHVGTWIGKLLAILCVVILVWAAGLYFTGRGIARCSATARLAGITLSLLGLLVWLALLLLLPRSMTAVPIFGCALSLYTIWVLGWRYAPVPNIVD